MRIVGDPLNVVVREYQAHGMIAYLHLDLRHVVHVYGDVGSTQTLFPRSYHGVILERESFFLELFGHAVRLTKTQIRTSVEVELGSLSAFIIQVSVKHFVVVVAIKHLHKMTSKILYLILKPLVI